ncbi:structural maintenance of chromosomes protein 3 [Arachis hypogaea]|uniref:structural maintenance of chromosomes protein 3 n=1 Tax=Arachis hypogaea TaxID=3818 RepID=UPI0011056F98|nr:structural maintenance of chromosomes protein 3-like isoform X1 [Arachis hypogaea]XP_029150520.1 structural maintenance of chromosomes protein 3-like isoform X1 [Arachis hypogaea]
MHMLFFVMVYLFPTSNSFLSTELTSQIDQKITELVSEQQKIEAECAHGKSELEQFKQDIANANKQKQLISKALSKKVLLYFLYYISILYKQTEARKAELETNLTTNLRRRKRELEAVISSADDDTLGVDAGLKAQELSDAKLLVDDATEQLRRVSDSISARSKEIKQIKEEINKLKSLEDEYERKLQEETKELEQSLSKKNIYILLKKRNIQRK